MNTMQKLMPPLITLLASVFLLTACGGGGSGGGGGTVTYSGLETQATLDDSNVTDIAEVAYYGSELGGQPGVALAAQVENSESVQIPTPVIQSLTDLTLSLPELLPGNLDTGSSARTVYPIVGSDSCGISGSMSISGSFDDVSGDLNATITYNSCNNDGETILNGAVDFSGTGFVADEFGEPVFDNVSMSVSYKNLSFQWIAEEQKITVAGTSTLTLDSTGIDPVSTIDMTLVVRDDITGQTAKLVDYQVVVTDFPSYGYEQVSISGLVYFSDYGYVELSTPTPILVDYATEEPYQGIYRLDGATGTWAEVDFSLSAPQGTWGDATGTLGTFSI